jgi:hypothetical protein
MSIAIDVTAWAADRATGIATLQALGIADVDANGDIVPLVQAHIHPFRASEQVTCIKVPAVYENGVLVTPAEIVPGWHVNIRYYGATALNLLAEEPYEIVEGPMGPARRYLGWTEADSLFERTLILDMIDQRTGQAPVWYALEEIPQPPGYQMAGGAVRLYDPALISSQSCVFA